VLRWPSASSIRTALLALVAILLLAPLSHAEDAPAGSPGERAQDPLGRFESKWLSNASCVKCHFHVPPQTSNRLTYLSKLVEKGYATEQAYRDALKRHMTTKQCRDCHEASNEPQGQCTRGDECLRDVHHENKVTYLGVSVGAVPAAVRPHVKLPKNVGLMIESIEPDSPAAESELRAFDILEKLDRQLLVNQEQFSVLIKMHRPSEEVSLELIRGNEPRTLSVKLGERVEIGESSTTALALATLAASNETHAIERGLSFLERSQATQSTDSVPQTPAETPQDTEAGKVTYLGINSSPPPDALREQLKLPKGLYLVIDSVEADSPAAAAGLRSFDVLQKLDDQLLVNSEQLTVLIRNHRAGDDVELTLIRDGQPLKLRAALGEHRIGQMLNEQAAILAEYDRILTLNAATELVLKDVANAELSDAIDLSMAHDVNDEEYIRRVYLDLTGAPPSPQEVQKFVSDDALNKRQQLIDRLLNRPEVIAKIRDSAVLEWSDGEHSLVLTTGAGQKRLLAKEKQGKVLFDGPVDTDDERQQLGPRLAAKLELMLKGLTAGPTGAPADAGADLEKILPHFQAGDETLLQLLDRLRRETGANIVVDRKALAAVGVTLDDPLSLDLHDVRGLTVLKMLLTLAGGGKDRLTYQLDEGVVLITAAR
jgi:PDZ domain-containing secreted protein